MSGDQRVQLSGSKVTNPADALASAAGLVVVDQLEMFNGSTWDQQRNNTQGTLLASAARTATTSSAIQTNYNARGVIVNLHISQASGTGGLQLSIQGIDPVMGSPYSMHNAPTATTTTGDYTMLLYPGATSDGIFKKVVGQALPRQFLVQVNHGDASSYTYSLSYALIV